MWYCFLPLGVYIFFLIGCYLFSSASIPSEPDANPEIIIGKDQQVFIYKKGTAIQLSLIKKFRVSNPFPNKYEIDAYIGWDTYVIKSGFNKREDAEEWLELFLKDFWLTEEDKRVRASIKESVARMRERSL